MMADYGIFGHGSSGNSWFANKLNDFHDSTKKFDPLTHKVFDDTSKWTHGLVENTAGLLAKNGIGEGFNTRLSQEANENQNDFGLGTQRMLAGIGTTLGAMYGYGAMAGGGSGAAGSTGAGAEAGGGMLAGTEAPTALGYGTEGMSAYTMPASDGTAVGSWFDINGMPEGSQFANDIPTNNPTWSKMTKGMSMPGQMGGGGQSGGGRQASLRQNLPLYENEKTDYQKMLELAQALQRYQGGEY